MCACYLVLRAAKWLYRLVELIDVPSVAHSVPGTVLQLPIVPHCFPIAITSFLILLSYNFVASLCSKSFQNLETLGPLIAS